MIDYSLIPIGFVQSPIKIRKDSPMRGSEEAPDVWIEINKSYAACLDGVSVNDELIIITLLHLSNRYTLKVHPRSNMNNPLTGVFATRSPDRPNPLGLHRVKV